MVTKGNFVFKGIEEKKGGEFKNDKGDLIKYNAAYQIALDELVNGKVITRTFKFSKDNQDLFNKLKALRIYENVVVEFDIQVYRGNVKLVPTDVYTENDTYEVEE